MSRPKAAIHRGVDSLILLVFTLFGSMLHAGDTPANALLVLSKGDNTLTIVDPSSLQVVARIPVGHDPHEVTASADGKTAFVSNLRIRSLQHTRRSGSGRPKSTACHRSGCLTWSAWTDVRGWKGLVYRRGSQSHWPLRSHNWEGRLDPRDRPEQNAHALRLARHELDCDHQCQFGHGKYD
jgi:YVTN family beta-propeller protein